MAVTKELIDKISEYQKQGYTSDEIYNGIATSENYPKVAQKAITYRSDGYTPDEIIQGIINSPVDAGIEKVAEAEGEGLRERFYGLGAWEHKPKGGEGKQMITEDIPALASGVVEQPPHLIQKAFGGLMQMIAENPRLVPGKAGKAVHAAMKVPQVKEAVEDVAGRTYEYGDIMGRTKREETLRDKSDRAQHFYGAGASIGTMAMALPFGVEAAPILFGLQAMGENYPEYRAAGASPEKAAIASTVVGLAEYLPERYSIGKLLKGKIGKFIAGEIIGEQMTTAVQSAVDQGILSPSDTWEEALDKYGKSFGPNAEATLYQTLIASLVMGGAGKLATTMMEPTVSRSEQAVEKAMKKRGLAIGQAEIEAEKPLEPTAKAAELAEKDVGVEQESITSNTLRVGDVFTKGGEEFKVENITPLGTVRVADGVNFSVPENQEVFVDKGSIKHAPPEKKVKPVKEKPAKVVPITEAKKPEAKPLPEAVEKATTTLKDFVDKTPKAGMSIADISGQKKVNDAVNMPEGGSLESVSKVVEERYQAHKGLGRKGLLTRFTESLKSIAKQTRTFTELSPKKFPKEVNIFREYSAVAEYAKHTAVETTAGPIAGLGPKKYDVFTRNIILPDIMKDVESGLLTEDRIPFGYKNAQELQKDISNFRAIAEANPDIKQAIETRQKFKQDLTNELVKQELLNEEVLKDERYYHHQVLQKMAERRATPGVSSRDVRLKTKGFQRGRIGSSLDFNTEYIEAEAEWIGHALSQLKTKEILGKIKEASDISDKVEKGEIPEGYVEWQPVPGTVWYKAISVPDRIIQEVLAGTRQLSPEDLRAVVAKGGPRKSWIIPQEVAKTLDNFRDFSKDEGFDRFVRSTMSSWKQWVLMNPLRVLKYNFNNMSGDLDIALAYDPKILKYFKQASHDAWQHHKGAAMSRDMREALEHGVITSGITIQEIPEIADIGLFRILTSDKPNIITKWWKYTKELTQLRENLLRISAYKYFKAELAKGKKLYAASNPAQVDAAKGNEKAALLARDLIGDYGNISQAGQWLRQRMIPFWSWMEINAPRYVRLMRNASLEGKGTGRVAGTIVKKGAFKTAKIALQANILYGAITAWNAAMMQMLDIDEKEKRALYFNRRQLHLILGRAEDGKLRTIRMQGALSDALDWFALGNWPDVIRDIQQKRISGKDQLAETAKAPINRIVNASHPVLKTTGEIITGKQIYPDIWKPRPIRDKTEHALRILSLDMPWRWLTGKPVRGVKDDALSVLVYSNDPAERSYWNVKRMTYDYLDRVGIEKPSIEPTKKSSALYYYKQAKRFKDEKAAEKYLKRYIELGGTFKGLKRSFKMTAPLGGLTRKQRYPFLKTLSPEEKGQVEMAEEWFNKYMKLSPKDVQAFWGAMREQRRK